MSTAFLGIGTNLGDREKNLVDAVAATEEFIGSILRSSSVYETEPWGFDSNDSFLNLVVKAETDLDPEGVLGRIFMIEKSFGRVRGEDRYSSRVIDIDILFFDELVLKTATLEVPHPELHKRKFVLVPLCEIEPDLIHPVLNQTVSSLLKNCEDSGKVTRYIKT